MTKIVQRLITFGDSFTYGQELKDPKTSSWPQLVANYLDVPLINKAILGNSNDFIQEQLLGETYDIHDLVIICFTSITRIYVEDYKGTYTTIGEIKSDIPARNEFTKLLHSHAVDRWFYRRWLVQMIYMQEFLKSRGTRFLFANAFSNETFYSSNWRVNKKLIDQIDLNKFIGWPHQTFIKMTKHFPFGPFNHPLEEAHEFFAKFVSQHLKDIYDLPKDY